MLIDKSVKLHSEFSQQAKCKEFISLSEYT